MNPTDKEIEAFLRESFEQNFELLKLESGHSLGADIKDAAWNQVLFYWRKLKDIATRVTETEVRLNLPDQESPGGRKFGIEGVVDIVREGDQTVMYDIKTHDADQVRENIADYEPPTKYLRPHLEEPARPTFKRHHHHCHGLAGSSPGSA